MLNARNRTYLRLKRRVLGKHLWIARSSFVLFIGLLLLGLILLILSLLGGTPVNRYYVLGRNFIFTPKSQIQSIDKKTNILILGKSGGEHIAPDLTDTIMVAVIDHENPKVSLISIPRDIWIPDLRTKINSVYFWGNKKEDNGGLVLAKASVEEVVGIPIHYAVVIDFTGFEKLIDTVGGIDINVEKSFTDERFPIPGREDDDCGDDDEEFLCRYETLVFNEGPQTMDGETALKFVRSRQSTDLEEGTDFARSKRQQKAFFALKDKLLDRSIISSPRNALKILKVTQEITETDIPEPALAVLARVGIEASSDLISYVIPEDLLVNPPLLPEYDNLYVFIPQADSWEEVHNWVKRILSEDAL